MIMDLKTVVKVKQALLANKLNHVEIAEKFSTKKVKLSRSQVSNIATNRSYREIEPLLQPQRIPGGQPKHLNIETQNVALVGQLENTRQERNLLKRQLKAASQRKAIVDDIVERLSPIILPMKPFEPVSLAQKAGKDVIEETLVLVLSDTHCDQVVTPGEVDDLEEFDFPIAVRRAEVLVEEMLKFTLTSLANFRFRKLKILAIGDFTSGELHGHVNRSYFGEQFTNDLAIAQLFSHMFTELAAHFEEVEVVTIVGNHGRLTQKIEYTKEAIPANHDTLIVKVAEIHCKDVKNIKFTYPGGLSTIHNIEGWNFYLHHGHGQKSGSETWTRAKRKSQTIVPLHRGKVNYLVTGHFHTEGTVRVSGGATLIGNGAFLACDPYSYQGIEEAGVPCQVIFGVHKRNGVTWRLPIAIRTKDEKKGPQRYRIPALEAKLLADRKRVAA